MWFIYCCKSTLCIYLLYIILLSDIHTYIYVAEPKVIITFKVFIKKIQAWRDIRKRHVRWRESKSKSRRKKTWKWDLSGYSVWSSISGKRERDTLKIEVKYQDLILRISGEYSKGRYKFVTRNHQVGHLVRTLQQNSVIKIPGNKSLRPITKMIP